MLIFAVQCFRYTYICIYIYMCVCVYIHTHTHTHTHTHILFHILFHYGLSQDIDYSSLCYTVGPRWLSTL